MLEERDQRGGHGDELLRRDVHVIDALGLDFEELSLEADRDLLLEVIALLVDRRIRHRDDEVLFLVGGEVIDLRGHLAVDHLAVGGLDEAELVDAGEARHRGDQADVRSFRGLDRADAAVVGGVDVADFEAGAVAGETPWPEGRETPLVRQLGERIGLIHQLRELAAGEEVADRGRKRLRIDQLLRGHAFRVHVEQGHALLDEALGAGQAGAALVREEFPDGTDAAATEVIDIVSRALALAEADDVLGGGDDVVVGQDAGGQVDVDAELLVDLVAADAAQVIALVVEEEALEQDLRVRDGRGIAGAEAAVDLLQRLVGVAGGVLLEALDDGVVVLDVDDLHGLLAELENLADDALGERLEGAGHDLILVGGVADLADQHLGADAGIVELAVQLQILDRIEEADDLLVGVVAEGAEQGGDEELPAAFPTVEMDVEEVGGVEGDFHPGAAIGDDPVGEQQLPIRMDARLEADAGGAVQLADDDALGAVDDEIALAGHHGQLAHVDPLFLGGALLAEAEGDVKGGGVGLALANALDGGKLGFADLVGGELELDLAVVALDREDFGEDGLEALGAALGGGNLGLEEIAVGLELVLDEIRDVDRLVDLPEIDALHGFLSHNFFLLSLLLTLSCAVRDVSNAPCISRTGLLSTEKIPSRTFSAASGRFPAARAGNLRKLRID